MARGPRLDVEGGVSHVVARGAQRRALARAAVMERGIRAVEMSRYLGVGRAAITAQLQAHDT